MPALARHAAALRRALAAGAIVYAGAIGAAPAQALDGNVVVDGGGENVTAHPTDQRVPPAWTARGGFSVRGYGAAGGWPDTADRDAVGGGSNFFEGGPTPGATGTQVIDLSSDAQAIARGNVKATLSAFLGGYLAQSDYATVTAEWLDGASNDIGTSISIGPVTHSDRQDQTELQTRSATASVPTNARAVRVVIEMTRFDPTNDDGYADNVSLVLTDATSQQQPPSSPPPGGQPPVFTFAPVNLGPPQVQGDTTAGGAVGCLNGVWTLSPSFSYAWSLDGAPIPGADSVSYTLPGGAKGHKIACTVTGTTDGGAATATSDAVKVAPKQRCPLVGGKPTCLKRGRACKATLRDDYLLAGFVCKRRGKKRVLARASEAALRGDSFVRLGPDGLPSFAVALQAFDKVIAPLPGVKQKPGVVGDTHDGSEALRWILRYEDRLTPAQKAVVDRMTAPPPEVTKAAESPGVASYRALIPEALRRLQAHGITLRRGVTLVGGAPVPGEHGNALAISLSAWHYGMGENCIITITPEGAADFGNEGKETLVHELFHCAQGEALKTREQYDRVPSWVTEGGATWVESRIGVEWSGRLAGSTKDWYLVWLGRSQRDLFGRDYDGVGFYELLAHQGADVWPLLLETARAAGNYGPNAGFFTGLNAADDVTGAWGPTLATANQNGRYWDLDIPGFLIRTTLHGQIIKNGTEWARAVAPRGGYAAELPIKADIVTIATAGGPIGRFKPPGEDDQPLRNGEFCARPGGCECPDGGNPQLPDMKRGSAYIGWSGMGTGAVVVSGESLDKWCKKPRQDGINIYTLTSGGQEPLAGTIKAGNCKVAGGVFTAQAKSTNREFTLKARIEAFKGFGHDYSLFYGQSDPSFTLDGPGGPYSNVYPVPGSPGGGAISLSRDGKGMGFGFVPTFNADQSAGVSIAGAMTCRYPRKRG